MVTKKKKTAQKPVYRKVRYYQVSGYFYKKVFLFFWKKVYFNHIYNSVNARTAGYECHASYKEAENCHDLFMADVEFIEEVEELVPPLFERFFNNK